MKMNYFDNVTGEKKSKLASNARLSIQNNSNNQKLLIGKNKHITYLINQQPDIDKIYTYAKNLYEIKHELLTNKRLLITRVCLKHCNYSEAFAEYSNGTDNMKILINTVQIKDEKCSFDDMICLVIKNVSHLSLNYLLEVEN